MCDAHHTVTHNGIVVTINARVQDIRNSVTKSQPLALATYALIVLTAWMLMHLYWGLAHDAVLYTMQGLAHLRPDLYGNDIYLRYGSQDGFSIFGDLYAPLIGWFGVDHAAAVVTGLSQICFLAAAWTLARYLMPASMALLGLGLLVVMELPYGSGGTFHVLEDFMSPRPLSEALVLLSVWAALKQRDAYAVVLMVLAAAIHPLMACAGAAWLIWSRLITRRPLLAAVASVLVLAVLAGVAHWQPSARMDDAWLNVSSPYVLIANWNQVDLSGVTISLTTLLLAILLPWSPTARALAIATLGMAVSALALSGIGGDGLHLALIIQGQAWRWLWLSEVIAVLSLPMVIGSLWSGGMMTRAALALLIAGYLFHDVMFGFFICLLALAVAGLGVWQPKSLDSRQQHLILWGSVTMLLIGLTWDIANRVMFAQIPFITFPHLKWVSWLRRGAHGSLLPALLLCGCWWIAFSAANSVRLRVLAVLALVAFVVTAPISATIWTRALYTQASYQAFGAWRSRIPVGTEVLMSGTPLFSWVLLERPSYLSQPQTSTALFSRQAGLVMLQREQELGAFLRHEGAVELVGMHTVRSEPEKAVTLSQVCQIPDLRFIVTRNDLSEAPVASLPASVPADYRGLKLYQCGARE